jgi:antitoxin Phd
MHVSATELKNKLGQYIEAAITEPVIVEKSSRPVSVVISYQEFQRFLGLEDELWGLRAREAGILRCRII